MTELHDPGNYISKKARVSRGYQWESDGTIKRLGFNLKKKIGMRSDVNHRQRSNFPVLRLNILIKLYLYKTIWSNSSQ